MEIHDIVQICPSGFLSCPVLTTDRIRTGQELVRKHQETAFSGQGRTGENLSGLIRNGSGSGQDRRKLVRTDQEIGISGQDRTGEIVGQE